MKKYLLTALTMLLTATPAPQASAILQKRLHQAGAAALCAGSVANAVDAYNKRERLSQTILALRMLASVAGIVGAVSLLSKAANEDTTQTNNTTAITQPDPVSPSVAPHPAVQPAPSRALVIAEPAALLGLNKISLHTNDNSFVSLNNISEHIAPPGWMDYSYPAGLKDYCRNHRVTRLIGVSTGTQGDIFLIQVGQGPSGMCIAMRSNGSLLSAREFCELCGTEEYCYILTMLNSPQAIRDELFKESAPDEPGVCV